MDPRMQMLARLMKSIAGGGDPSIVARVKAARLTFLEESALRDLYEAVLHIEQAGLPGQIIEAGCALGGSALVMATAKRRLRRMTIYDVFAMLPPPSERDGKDVHAKYAEIVQGKSAGIGGDKYYGYRDNLLSEVRANFAQFGVAPLTHRISMVKGLFFDTLKIDSPVALAHIDADWFDSVTICLEQIAPRLVKGGALVIDDYDHWSGCKAAVDLYFKDRMAEFDFVRKSRLHIVKR